MVFTATQNSVLVYWGRRFEQEVFTLDGLHDDMIPTYPLSIFFTNWFKALQVLVLLYAISVQPETKAQDFKPTVKKTDASIATWSGSDKDVAISSLVLQYQADQKTLGHRFRLSIDPIGMEYKIKMLEAWGQKLDEIDFAKLPYDDQIDWLMLRSEVRHDSELHANQVVRDDDAKKLFSYSDLLLRYCATKEYGSVLDAEDSASLLDEIATQANASAQAILKAPKSEDSAAATVAVHAVSLLDQLARQVQDTHRYHDSYDPEYTWWAGKPFEAAKTAMSAHRRAVREVLAGLDENDKDKIVGVPIGADALGKDLRHAWITYSAAELVAIGEFELAWCDERFKQAANELNLDGDWRKALEHVKTLHVEPGDQPKLVRELAWEAIRFLEMAKQGWRVEMMSPEAQRVNPYFLGGDNIIVSFPTNTMTHAEKLMSLKSNNIHFCRATVHHELVPGHHLQYYVLERYRPYRQLFSSPFWMEGWALYWEMQLWDMGFAGSPEDRVGMLFWRRHRAARIVFSLNYQLGKWSAEECVQYLIDRVGHEPSAAAAEVRRSIMGGYGPLYQAGYMLGGLQLRALHAEIVQAGKMNNRDFHDAILKENYIPFELLRLKMLAKPLSTEQLPVWKFHTQK
jgi:uncharacterized protein (DUF885 family)